MITIGISLLIGLLYLGSQIWNSWWSDGEFIFLMKDKEPVESEPKDSITIKNTKGIANLDLNEVRYFFSESKIVFLVDTSGKKRITQYTLSELEQMLGERFFRLNRKTLVSRQVISHFKKLPNHRLLVTIGQSDESLDETVSKYKSTRFKQWLQSA